MGRRNGPYNPDFPRGTCVRIAPRAKLEEVMASWKLHNPLQPEQLSFAGRVATVKDVGYYHGADELYSLDQVPGSWHEACLESSGENGAA